MAKNTEAIFPIADMRNELRIPGIAGLDQSIARHISAAISHIEKRTSLVLVDRDREYLACIPGANDPAFLPLQSLASIVSVAYWEMTQARREIMTGTVMVADLELRRVAGGYEVANVNAWPQAMGWLFNFTVTQGIPVAEIPHVLKDVIVMQTRDAIDGVPRASTERAISDLLKPWIW